MTILVTGAGGFVGAGLVRWLSAAHPSREIYAADLAAPAGAAHPLALDVVDRAAVREAVARLRPDAVVHAAALTLTDPVERLRVFDVNLGGTINVLDATAEAGVARVVVASSSGVYATGAGEARHEDDATDAGDAYAASKLGAEAAAACWGAVAVRIGPAYGPGETARASRPRISAIGAMAAALREGRPVRLSGAEVSRDWTCVDDIARGIDALLSAPHPRHRVYNLSAGRGATLAQVADAFARQGLKVDWAAPETADVALRLRDARPPLSIARLADATGFKPQHTVETGIAALVAAERKEGP